MWILVVKTNVLTKMSSFCYKASKWMIALFKGLLPVTFSQQLFVRIDLLA